MLKLLMVIIMRIKCPAKINLFLNIQNKKDDGYHNIKTIVQTIDLFDEIILSKRKDRKINIKCNNPDIPCDETNSVFKAIKIYYEYIKKDIEGYDITIIKNIPNKAGLGGESSDACGIIKLLNKEYNLPYDDLLNIAKKIGDDCKYFLKCGCLDEEMNEIKNPYQFYLLINSSSEGCSTKEMFRKYDELNEFENLEKKINLVNDFEKIYNIEKEKITLTNKGCIMAGLTGSGSYVVGILEEKKEGCYQNYNLPF